MEKLEMELIKRLQNT